MEQKDFSETQGKDRYLGVNIENIISARGELKEINPNFKKLTKVIEQLASSPDLLLEMPRLDGNSFEVERWMDKLEIENLSERFSVSEIATNFKIAPEVIDELKSFDSISVKNLFEAIRKEFAVRIFTNRKIDEVKKLFSHNSFQNLEPESHLRIGVYFQTRPRPDVNISGYYLGNVEGRNLISLEGLPNKDPYFNPHETFEAVVEHDITWALAHELGHAWLNKFQGTNGNSREIIELTKKEINFDSASVHEIINGILLNSIKTKENKKLILEFPLSKALEEGFSVFVETSAANADLVINTNDDELHRKLLDLRKRLYLGHLDSRIGSPYYEGFYQVVRKIRQKVRRTDQFIKLFSLIDYQACSSINVENKEGQKFITDPMLIPLVKTQNNSAATIGEYIANL